MSVDRVVARALLGVALLLVMSSGMLLLLSLDATRPDIWGFRGSNALIGVSFAITGYVIAARRPRNPIGWLFLLLGLASSADGAGLEYATYSLFGPRPLPNAAAGAWVHEWIWAWYPALVALAVLHFPDGRLLGARWRPIGWVAIASATLASALLAFRPGRLQTFNLENPFPLSSLAPTEPASRMSGLTGLVLGTIVLSLVISLASVLIRFVRSHGETRQQLKLFGLSAGAAALALTSTVLANDLKVTQVATVLAFTSVPISIAVAILRYRLYDVDVLINRTVVYAATSAVVAVTFFAGIVAVQTLLRPLTAGSEIAVAASTLLSFALFQPIRRRVQAAIDRRFDRARYDAARTLEAFADNLRDEVDLAELRSHLTAVVRQTMAPAHASLWLRRNP